MVCTFGAPGSPPAEMVEAMRVSVTMSANAGISTGCGRSVRRNTIPVSGAAGRSVSSTFCPLCKPTPTARVSDFKVRCLIMGWILGGDGCGACRITAPFAVPSFLIYCIYILIMITFDEAKRRVNLAKHGVDMAALADFFEGDLLTREDAREAWSRFCR